MWQLLDKVVDVPEEVPQFKFSLVEVVDVPVVQIVVLRFGCGADRGVPMPQIMKVFVGKLAVEQIVVCQATDHGGFRGEALKLGSDDFFAVVKCVGDVLAGRGAVC